MHDTAMMYGKLFFETYLENSKDLIIVDIGAQNVNGSLREVAPKENQYIGVDFVEGKGVDVVLTDPYQLPFETASVDVIVSSSCLEHSEFFWLSFNEMLRVLKPSGLMYINVPSNGAYHRYPIDSWRFYPDSGVALQNWGNHSGYSCAMLESFVGIRKKDVWHDFVSVYVKDKAYESSYSHRMQKNTDDFSNGRLLNSEDINNHIENFQTIKRKEILSKIKFEFKKNFGKN